jgi:DNA repair exonuclease SbcCD ATPase subunit
MQLSAADRRNIIEDLLDIQIFSSMNAIVKEKMSALKDGITKSKYDIKLVEEKINLQMQNIEENKKNNDAEIGRKLAEIGESKMQMNTLRNDVEKINRHVSILQSKVGDKKEKLDKKAKGLFQIKGKVQTNIDRNEKEIQFYENNHDCPTCKQSITPEWKDSQVKEKTEKITTQRTGLQEIEEELKKVTDEVTSITDILTHINEHNGEIIKHNSTISAISSYITKLNGEIDELNKKGVETEGSDQKLVDLKNELKSYNTLYEEQLTEKHYHEFAGTLLKDGGIKTRIIKQYLPIMNKLINKYLTAMDFFVNFNINENFEETIKSRHRDEFSYANFSEGEKMRIDLALLFTWRQIAKLKNSTNTNLLILDEVFDSSLDTVGTEEFLKLINEMGTDTNVFVISHKGDQLFDKFRSIIRFEKKNNFSRIAK